jgi:hypothetical protein
MSSFRRLLVDERSAHIVCNMVIIRFLVTCLSGGDVLAHPKVARQDPNSNFWLKLWSKRKAISYYRTCLCYSFGQRLGATSGLFGHDRGSNQNFLTVMRQPSLVPTVAPHRMSGVDCGGRGEVGASYCAIALVHCSIDQYVNAWRQEHTDKGFATYTCLIFFWIFVCSYAT